MAIQPSSSQRRQLSDRTRARFVEEAARSLDGIADAIRERLTALISVRGTAREMQDRSDAWAVFQQKRAAWVAGTGKAWQAAVHLKEDPAATNKEDPLSLEGSGELSLMGTEAMEEKILVSRMVLAVSDKAGSELEDLKVRIRALEDREDLAAHDIFRPEELIGHMLEQWQACGLVRESWSLVSDDVQKLLIDKLKAAYASANQHLIQHGFMPTIDLKDRVKRSAASRRASGGAGPDSVLPPDSQFHHTDPSTALSRPAGLQSPPAAPAAPTQAQGSAPAPRATGGLFGGRLGWGSAEAAVPPPPAAPPPVASGMPVPVQGRPAGGGGDAAAMAQSGPTGLGKVYEETRMLTQTTPLARTRQRAQGMFGQLKRLLIGQGGGDMADGADKGPSPGLAAAIAVQAGQDVDVVLGTGTVYEDYSPAGVVRVAGQLRAKTAELKQKAETKSEKAIIEMVALMFQAILAEERIPPAIRVWFARLQMPVLRVALGDSEFFGSINHPARQLIDRMGSCVLGFDASGISGSALEAEIRRIVQVIEQYPETGKKVFQIVYDEFQKFLAKYLTGKEKTQKLVSVAQQVEQKETLTIQYTIELRNLLKDIPVPDEVRTFLFKVWAEVLAVSAVRKGPKDAETVGLKKAAADLIWSAGAKPNRKERARVVQDLPQLLQRLRAGMDLLGLSMVDQDAHIKIVSDTLADAFMSKTQAIPQEQVDAITQRLANLEDFVSEDGLGDLPLDSESIEMMLGIDASSIVVVADGGSRPTAAMAAWAQELQVGSWFTLDLNGRVNQVQFVWRSDRKHLNLFASTDGRSYLIQAGRLAAYLQAGLLLPQEEETLTVRATREALTRLEAHPEQLLA